MAQGLKAVKDRKNLYEIVADNLKEAILAKEFPAGQALPGENEMAQQLNVSRPVVREAVRYLQAKGLIEVRRGIKGGAFVCNPEEYLLMEDISGLIRTRRFTVDHIIQARMHIEPEIFRLAAKQATEKDMQILQDIVDETLASEDIARKAELNFAFHRQVAKMCGNPIYHFCMMRILDFINQFITVIKPVQVFLHRDEDHPRVLGALKSRDGESAAREITRHLEHLMGQLKKYESIWLKMSRENR
jgi:GntR family transcriptional repressor for pyruvate dehydrogenase complex